MLQSSFEKHVQSHVVLPPVARGLVVEDSLQVEHVGAPVLVCEHAAGPALKEMGDGVAQCVAVIVHAICHIRAYDEVEGPLGKLLAAEEQPLHADARTALREQQPLVLLRVVLQLLEKLVRSAVCEQDTRRAEAGCVEAADPRPCAELEDARAAHGGGVCPKPSDHRERSPRRRRASGPRGAEEARAPDPRASRSPRSSPRLAAAGGSRSA
eukprot:CAMPEP_0182829884 /NCGR_PEP_ID=MMETSP0006_2-20121128/18278_1 /TAXON_ID=97485 /ORGANISM="Prymnesium parvum, Strain Texoma1" /LENGTH=210 /DNA_ID=CAMNT_0024957411 /DNA_START=331 /DNA_END=960 /DNA_ORIENTATION=-